MNALDLKQLNKISSVFVISGNDAYLRQLALNELQRKLVPSFSDLNLVNLSAQKLNENELFEALCAYPFGDSYKMIVLNDLKVAKQNKSITELLKVIANHAKLVEFSTVLVIVNPENLSASDINGACFVDCSHLSEEKLARIIEEKVKESGLAIENRATQTLINFTLCDLTRINLEVNKLIAFKNSGEISEEDVKRLVNKDVEFQVFEIQEKIAQGKYDECVLAVTSLYEKEKNAFSIISPLYNNYRRALFIAINKNESDETLASLLQIKPFAVKMLRKQVAVFSVKKLKNIVDNLYALDSKIKQGKIKEDIGLITEVFNIIEMRKNS